jgi:hypothetical protein
LSEQWFIFKDQEQKGPLTREQLDEQVQSGAVGPKDQVWKEGMDGWVSADQVEGLLPEQASSYPPPVHAAPPPPPPPVNAPSPPPPPAVSPGPGSPDITAPASAPQVTGFEAAPPARKKKSGLKIAAIIGGSLVALLIILILVVSASVRGALRSSEVYARALADLQSNPQAVQLLGEPIEAGKSVSGEINVSNGSGDTVMSIPVSGPLSKGDLNVSGVRANGIWQLTSLELVTENGENLNLLAGTGPASEGMLTFNEPGYGFVINYPRSWDYGIADNIIEFRGPPGTEEFDNIVTVQILFTREAGGMYSSFDEIYADLESQYLNLNGSVFDYETGVDYIGDTEHPYMVMGAYFESEGVEYMELSFVLQRDSEYYYLLYYTVPVAMGDKYMDLVFDDIFESFRFVDF